MEEKEYKEPPYSINGSNTFPARGRCKHCGKCALHWKPDWTNPWPVRDWRRKTNENTARLFRAWVGGTNQDLLRSLVHPEKTGWYVHSYGLNGYRTGAQRNPGKWISPDMIMLVCANCGKSKWAALDHYNADRLDIKHRKARLTYPQKAKPSKDKW